MGPKEQIFIFVRLLFQLNKRVHLTFHHTSQHMMIYQLTRFGKDSLVHTAYLRTDRTDTRYLTLYEILHTSN